jgi:hypothetical protein
MDTTEILQLLIARADEALYEAKRLGGNMVCVYGVDVPFGTPQSESRIQLDGEEPEPSVNTGGGNEPDGGSLAGGSPCPDINDVPADEGEEPPSLLQ